MMAALVRLAQGDARDLESRSFPWEKLAQAAFEHGMLPALAPLLLARIPPGSEDAAMRVQAQLRRNAHRCLAIAAESARLVGELEARGIPAALFKGPLLSELALGSPILRQAGDIDIVLARSDRQAALDHLARNGFRLDQSLSPLLREGRFEFDCECELTNAERRMCIDLHWDFTARNFSLPLPAKQMLARSSTLRWLGREVRTFSTIDQLLLLCLHGSKHSWARLEWIYTISRFLARQPELDWKRALREAERMRLTHIVHSGLKLAEALFDTPLPAVIADCAPASRRGAELAATALGWMGQAEAPSPFQTRRFHAAARDGWMGSLRFWLGVITTPNAKDYWIELPAAFRSLQLPLRLGRLLIDAVSTHFGRENLKEDRFRNKTGPS